MELTWAIEHIFAKTANKELPIGKDHFALAIFLIGNKIALIVDPVLVDEIEVAVVKGLVQGVALLVVELA